SKFDAEATSGASGGSSASVAGSLALNITTLHTNAQVDPGATIDVHGANLSLNATSTIENTVAAKSKQEGSGNVGVGASVAINIGKDTTAASVADGAAVSNAKDLALSATAGDTAKTTADAG